MKTWPRPSPIHVLIAAAILFNAITLLPEIAIPVPSNNDDATHFAIIQGASDALARGDNVLDPWFPELELGIPWFIYYQPAGALTVVALHRIMFGLVDLLTLFNLVRYLLLVLLPLTVYWSLRRMGVAPFGSAVAAASSSLLSGDFRYGFDYDSYTWRGFGMFTQLIAMHLSFITLSALWRAMTRGSEMLRATLAMTALVITHLIYGYMMAFTAAALVVAGAPSKEEVARRALRLVTIGAITAVLTAWMWLPFLQSRAFIGVSPYLQPHKLDSFGAPAILGWLVTGDLLDHGRLPVITALLAVGIIAALVTRSVLARAALAMFVMWLVLYFGRPTLGPVVDLLPMHEGLLIHRFIGSVDLFVILLVGVGADWLVTLRAPVPSARRLAVATAAAAIVLAPAAQERMAFHALGASWMRQTLAAIDADADARAVVDALRRQAPARVYAGQRNRGYGPSLNFGIPFNSVRMSDLLVFEHFQVVASPYSSMSLNADLVWDVNEAAPDQYDLLNARYVVQPAHTAAPPFLVPLLRTGRYILYQVYTSGFVEYVTLADERSVTTQRRLFDINRPWFNGADVAARRSHRFSFPASTDATTARETPGCARPAYLSETATRGRIEAIVSCPTASALIVKVSYHPNWAVTVDGRPAETFMASPSYVGVTLSAGEHRVVAEYRPSPAKTPLFAVSLAALASLAVIRRRRGSLAMA